MTQFFSSSTLATSMVFICLNALGQEAIQIRIQANVEGQKEKIPEILEIQAKAKVNAVPIQQRIRINAAPPKPIRILPKARVAPPPFGSPRILASDGKSIQAISDEHENLDRLRLFDGSFLRGNLIDLNENRFLRWANEAAAEPLSFRFSSVDSIELASRKDQEEKIQKKNGQNIQISFKNGDRIRGQLIKVDEDNFAIETSFAGNLDAKRQKLASVILLPPSHEILYDASQGISGWTPSNPNAWRAESGDLFTIVSGSIGRLLPEKDAIEIELDASWERSFYFRVQLFSDSQSRGYGSIGYDLSFSNNRMNLQVAKRKKGRLTRETIGSAVINDLTKSKSGHFRIFGNRKTKEFAVWLNGKQMARWKDGDEDFSPMGNSVVLYNQGGSSSLRLKDTTISGWDGDFAPVEPPTKEKASETRVTFVNGDSTTAAIGRMEDGKLFLETSRGKFATPLERIRSIHFSTQGAEQAKPASDRLWLKSSTGRLALNLQVIKDGFLAAESPNFGPIKVSLEHVRRVTCNLHLLELEKYLSELRLARKALETRNIQSAQEILQRTTPHLRGWLWGRLAFHAKALSSSEILSFVPHPESGLARAIFAGDSETILTVGKDATFGLWNGHARVASGKIEGSENLSPELGRFPNEAQHLVTISRDFWLGQFEVTQEQYEKLTGKNPSANKNGKMPVDNISWHDAVAYCELLNKEFPPPVGYLYRLPTEAEWESACRAGSEGPFSGTSQTSLPVDENAYVEHLEKFAWFSHNSENSSHPVGGKTANDHGIHDMHGNLWEWCLDHVELNKRNMLKTRIPGAIDPFFSEGRWRSLRGGSFNVSYNRCRGAYRGANSPDIKRSDRGFRVALAPDLSLEANATKELKARKPHELDKLDLRLMPVPAESFLMGSPETLPGTCAATVPGKDLIITGGSSGELHISDFAGRPSSKLGQKLPAGITALAASPDGKLCIAGCQDGSTHLLSLPEGKSIASFTNHNAPVVSAAFSSNGRQVASGGLDGKAFLYSSDGKGKNIILTGNSACFDNLDFSMDGKQLIASGQGASPTIWNTRDGSFDLSLRINLDDAVAARFSPGGQGAAVACRSGQILFCETSSGHTYNAIALSGRELSELRYSPDGETLLISTHEGLCSLRRIPLGNAISIVDANGSLIGSPDYYFDIAHSKSTSTVPHTLEAFIAKHNKNIQGDSLPRGSARSPDNAWILTTIDGALRLWRAETGKQEAILAEKLASPFENCGFSPDGLFAAGRLESGQILAYPAMPPSESSPKPNLKPKVSIIRSWLDSPNPR